MDPKEVSLLPAAYPLRAHACISIFFCESLQAGSW